MSKLTATEYEELDQLIQEAMIIDGPGHTDGHHLITAKVAAFYENRPADKEN